MIGVFLFPVRGFQPGICGANDKQPSFDAIGSEISGPHTAT